MLVCICATQAHAQPDQSQFDIDSPGLAIEAIAGWDGTVDRGGPIPLSFLIRNHSERMIEGEFRLYDPDSGREALLGEVVISPGGARRFTSIQALTDWSRCVAALGSGGQTLWEHELALSTGQEFDANFNFALFIHDGGRRLDLADPAGQYADPTAAGTSESGVAGERGWRVKCLTVKTWQVPSHPGPLVAAQAIIFPETANKGDLNQQQWRAVAEWMCQGGAVFVHEASHEIIAALTGAAPLGASAAVPSGQFQVRRVGLGAIYEFSPPLLSSAENEIRQRVGETVATLKRNQVASLIDSEYFYGSRGGRADRNRLWVVGLFSLYTIFSGVVALMLFRLNRRTIAIYIATVVGAASVMSAVLGGYLRLSQGDLRWMTVTLAGAGGVVQAARIEVQSAGGRNRRLAVHGEDADLQLDSNAQRSYGWGRRSAGCWPFSWQPNLASGEPDTYQIDVPMTPWGRRHLHATAYKREAGALDFGLKFEPGKPSPGRKREEGVPPGMPAGVFALKVVNNLPFEITDCWVVVGVTCKTSGQANLVQRMPMGKPGQLFQPFPAENVSSASGLIDVYQSRQIENLPPGTARQAIFDAQFKMAQNNWDRVIQVGDRGLTPPRIARLGAASAWIIGRIKKSPIIEIDQQRSDFLQQEQAHMFVQEILPESMPDASLFGGSNDPASVKAVRGVP